MKTELESQPRTYVVVDSLVEVKLCAPFVKGKSSLAREIAPPKGLYPVEQLILTTFECETAEEAFEKVRGTVIAGGQTAFILFYMGYA